MCELTQKEEPFTINTERTTQIRYEIKNIPSVSLTYKNMKFLNEIIYRIRTHARFIIEKECTRVRTFYVYLFK